MVIQSNDFEWHKDLHKHRKAIAATLHAWYRKLTITQLTCLSAPCTRFEPVTNRFGMKYSNIALIEYSIYTGIQMQNRHAHTNSRINVRIWCGKEKLFTFVDNEIAY